MDEASRAAIRDRVLARFPHARDLRIEVRGPLGPHVVLVDGEAVGTVVIRDGEPSLVLGEPDDATRPRSWRRRLDS